jgi:thiamine-phosphate pyrophosphorylase
MSPPIPKLLLITDLTVCPNLEQGVEAALRGGVKHLLLRIKNNPTPHSLQRWAEKLYPLTQKYQSQLLISGHISVALAFKGVGLHLPENALPTIKARQQLGPHRLLGRSCHDLEGALRALDQGANYITLSPLFSTQSHPEATPMGPNQFAQMCAAIPGPVIALGGINEQNLSVALKTGAYGIALIRAILAHPNPTETTKKILRMLIK